MTTEYIETRMIPLEELTPFPGNSRRGDKERIAESLGANGQYRSLIVRRAPGGNLVVLCGNNTLEALEQAGADAARCEIHTCDDDTALRINLVDNALNDRATYDDAARARQIAELDSLVGSGYTEDEADTLLARYEEPEIVQPEEITAEHSDSAEERRARIESHGGTDSHTYESRGVRDIFLALPAVQADELGRLIMRLREAWGDLPQGEVLLRAARVARQAVESPDDVDLGSADAVYAPESVEEQAGG